MDGGSSSGGSLFDDFDLIGETLDDISIEFTFNDVIWKFGFLFFEFFNFLFDLFFFHLEDLSLDFDFNLDFFEFLFEFNWVLSLFNYFSDLFFDFSCFFFQFNDFFDNFIDLGFFLRGWKTAFFLDVGMVGVDVSELRFVVF